MLYIVAVVLVLIAGIVAWLSKGSIQTVSSIICVSSVVLTLIYGILSTEIWHSNELSKRQKINKTIKVCTILLAIAATYTGLIYLIYKFRLVNRVFLYGTLICFAVAFFTIFVLPGIISLMRKAGLKIKEGLEEDIWSGYHIILYSLLPMLPLFIAAICTQNN